MFGMIMPLCNRMFCCIFGWYFYIEIRLKYEKNILLSSSRAFSLSTPTFSFSTPLDNSEATWKRATKCNKTVMQMWFFAQPLRLKAFLALSFCSLLEDGKKNSFQNFATFEPDDLFLNGLYIRQGFSMNKS